MTLTAWVDVAIGLTVVYLGASLFVTVINEYIAQLLNLRAKNLTNALIVLISDDNIKAMLAKSPALAPFFGDKDKATRKTPSYVDPNVLAQLLVGGLAATATAANAAAATAGTSGGTTTIASTFDQVSATIDELPDSSLKSELQAIVRTTETSTEALVKAVSDWLNRSLTMLGEGYKRKIRLIGLGIGLAVAVGFNIDTVALTEHLYRDKDAREAVVALGVQIADQTSKQTFDKCLALTPQQRNADPSCAPLAGLVDAVQARNATLGMLPIGWPLPATQASGAAGSSACLAWLSRLAGWLLTALALSLGAPFWFDSLNKLVNIRTGMRKPEVKDGPTVKDGKANT